MTEEKFIECCGDDRFEIIARAKEHIIEATNIEMSPEEMQVLDNFLFRCWQMDWLKNDHHALEKEIEELKAQIEKMQCCGNCSKRNECTMNVLDRLLCDKWSWQNDRI